MGDIGGLQVDAKKGLDRLAVLVGHVYLAGPPTEKQEAAGRCIAFVTSPEIAADWSQTTGYMPVRTSVVSSPAMPEYFKQRPTFETAVEQLPMTRPQEAGRVFVPNGNQAVAAEEHTTGGLGGAVIGVGGPRADSIPLDYPGRTVSHCSSMSRYPGA